MARSRAGSRLSFRKSSSSSIPRVEAAESPQEKRKMHITGKADPSKAINEAEPGKYRCGIDTKNNGYFNGPQPPRRAPYESGNHHGDRTGSSRPDSYYDNGSSPSTAYYGGPNRRFGPRNHSDPALYGNKALQSGQNGVYPSHVHHQSYDTVGTSTNGSHVTEPWGNSTDPSSENSSIDRIQPPPKPDPGEAYGFSGFGGGPQFGGPILEEYSHDTPGPGYGQAGYGQSQMTNGNVMPPQTNGGPPRVPPHGRPAPPPKEGVPPRVLSKHSGYGSKLRRGEYNQPPPVADNEKRKSWLKKRFSRSWTRPFHESLCTSLYDAIRYLGGSIQGLISLTVMESITETPRKKRRIEGDFASKGYNSQDDSGDDVFETFNTIETVPLPTRVLAHDLTTQFVTQPTQIIDRDRTPQSDGTGEVSVVQVQASSPAKPSIASSPLKPSPKQISVSSVGLATSLAPAGTSYRPPAGIIRQRHSPLQQNSSVIELSDEDDGPRYLVGSSDEESQYPKADIKPCIFKTTTDKVKKPSSIDKFREVTSKSTYNPTEPLNDISVDSIADYQVRAKVKRMRTILPMNSVLECRNALLEKRNNFDDAIDFLVAQGDRKSPTIDLTKEETSISSTQQRGLPQLKKPVAKQQLKAPAKKIHEKWAPTQSIQADIPSLPVSALTSPLTPPPKARKRLVQGRKNESPAAVSPIGLPKSKEPYDPLPQRSITPESESYDSGFGQEHDDGLEQRLLKFLNSCSTADLIDIAAVPEATANLLVSHQPFATLGKVRMVSVSSTKSREGAKSAKPIGDKVVDKCLDMWRGYEAVDAIIRECSDLARPIEKAIRKWGVNLDDVRKGDGELAIVDIETASNTTKDSGIGTPTSRSVSVDAENETNALPAAVQHKQGFLSQPSNMSDAVCLKDYQLVGLNWLALLYDQCLSGAILADDMGLGKTCQVIAFLAHLMQKGIRGPHLVVVPSSTLENWLREFSIFCPKLKVVPYHGSQHERPQIQRQIEADRDSICAVVTTYVTAKVRHDNKFLKKMRFVCCIYDEGHMLKNSKSAGYEAYMRIPATFRLLLTGTPLQNNLQELISLLGFILPATFREHRDDLNFIFNHKARTNEHDESHAALLSTQRIARAKSMMSPFVLRRKKQHVLKHLPQKHRRIEYCTMSESQSEIYRFEKGKALQIHAKRQAGLSTSGESLNIMMVLRQAAIHPLLFRRLYTDQLLKRMASACLKEKEFRDSNVDLVYEDMKVMTDYELNTFCDRYPSTMSKFGLQKEEWMDSGKVNALSKLLAGYVKNGDKVLVFSQFVMVMDILELVLETLAIRFFRLDGQTKVEERQTMIDEFYEDKEIPVFLLSTRAGGAGINLACANKVVIFDSSFNPQDDVQAENRAHRVGQTRDVEVVKFITEDTIEEQIYALGQTKLALDDRIAGLTDERSDDQMEKEGAKMVEEMLISNVSAETTSSGAVGI
ncbi:uncharacterized protein KY384_008334 [Bacidia gigantensis]|uniref:uncharacterized protein n=1 Tax=Bacidia gigantensis TaxID=2732470 RepID=UPI001D0477C6|nr:uncharacterized protein KY384_008334 [Bacidia gigantensis]KAG8526905.1 hypothetical protein KY384_008334 [Bacidia gigantensis]